MFTLVDTRVKNPGCDILVFLWLRDDMPGYLSYSYRTNTLLKHFDSILFISNVESARQELQIPVDKFIHVPVKGAGFIGTIAYYARLLLLIRKIRPKAIFFLHSFFAPVAGFIRNTPAALFWDEHPTHMFGTNDRTRARKLKTLKNRMMIALCFRGARAANFVMPISEHQRDDLIHHGCRRDRVQLIHLGVDKAFVPPVPSSNNTGDRYAKRPLKLIYTGSVSYDRGRDIMLVALAKANRTMPRVHLSIVGASPQELSLCERKSRELGIRKHLSVQTRVDGTKIPDMLHESDAGICIWAVKPHTVFNAPTKLFEYLAAGLPVLASRIRTHCLYIHDWDNGLIFDYDAESLAETFVELWKRQDEIPAMHSHALVGGRQYLWTQLEPQFLSMITSLVNDPRATAPAD